MLSLVLFLLGNYQWNNAFHWVVQHKDFKLKNGKISKLPTGDSAAPIFFSFPNVVRDIKTVS